MKRAALLAAKIAVSVALLTYLLATTDLRAIEARVRTADLLDLLVAVLFYCAMLALATWRWQLLLRGLGRSASLGRLTASYLIATFFNNFLPSNIGGDIVRVRDGSRLTGSTTASLAVVGIDRILGFGALYLLAAVAFVSAPPAVRGLAGARAVLLGLALVFSVLAYVFFRPGTAGRLMHVSRLATIGWARERFETVQEAVHAYRERLAVIWAAGGASLAVQALAVLYYLAVARALGIPLPAGAAFLMVPLCTLLQALPVSFNGWGLREGLFALYFAQLGLPRPGALAFSLVGAGLMVLLSLSGAVVWMTRGDG
ncbi:MAG TPA: lysylphosphatidylglycerol synthase transmembrane domain-containing protein, partial [Vicinamibacteria bacterium]|nr:lysylphosphatidylglycerol synthase transmembrane domain-containing protein [Vicinamibacteria bacterium]